MCPLSVESNADKKGIEFPFDVFCKVIDEGLDMGLKSIRMNYLNEPLLRKDLERFIEHAKKMGILDIYFSTNGMLLDEKRAESIIESGVDRIQISLDAYTEDTYNKMRPGGDYKKVVHNIMHLIEIKNKRNCIAPLIRVNFVRTELNEHELNAFIDFWENKADMIGVQEMVKPPRSTSNLKSKTTTKMESFKCSFPNKNLVITAEGNVLPCCTFYGDEMPIGNLFEELNKNKNFKISEFWNSPKMQNLRNLHCDGMYKMHPICKKCVEDSQY
ncbi:radical SAM protein [Helicobacter turcicus]|nr:radical SAM/SPASM domain-containing protein [Helicobacter turcicus]